MKFKFRADPEDLLMFIMFAIFLLYIVAIGLLGVLYTSLAEYKELTDKIFDALSINLILFGFFIIYFFNFFNNLLPIKTGLYNFCSHFS